MKLGRRERSDEPNSKQQQQLLDCQGASSSDPLSLALAVPLVLVVTVAAIIGGARILDQQQQQPSPQGSSSVWLSAQAAPIVTGAGGRRLTAGHVRSLLREPMPWEDGYFDPSYHAWPKNRQQQVADSKSLKLTAGEESVGGGALGSSGGGGGNGGSSGKSAESGA